jgi:site-specific DNA recombinase
MDATREQRDPHLLDEWMVLRRHKPPNADLAPGLRFAFYGRTSTVGHQDRASSHGWQREAADSLVAGHGVVVVEFFDAGCSRRLPWSARPEAAALLAELHSPERRFDALVVGEYERAFSGDQFVRLSALLDRLGVQVWLPEAGGPVRLADPMHRALVTVLGAQSQREVLRSRHRVLAAMRTQVREQGRFLGGRPPYGYRIVDAGPHPNRTHAGWGRRLRRLDPDPVTAPHVQWMFAQRLAGRSVASIARELTEQGVPCPSDADPERNRHRAGGPWQLRTVAVILGNPRYTGREVWDRQRTERGADDTSHRSTPAREWAVSATTAHPALVTEAQFVAAQQMRAVRPTGDGEKRRYLMSGLVQCALCGRRLDATWVHGRLSVPPRSQQCPSTRTRQVEDRLCPRGRSGP